MEKSLSIEENKSFNKVRNKKWYLPTLFYLLIFLMLLGCVLSMTRPMDALPDKNAFYVGTDVLGIAICVALFKGCMTGRESNGDMTFLFASLIFSNGALLFFDECSTLFEGIPELRGLNLATNICKFFFLPLLIYFFWRYVRFAAELDSYLKPWLIKFFQFAIIPIAALNLLNIVFPVYFRIDDEGFTNIEKLCIIPLAYALIAAIAILIGLARSKISKSHKTVIRMFFGVPLICSIFALSLYGATLFSVVLLYVVIYTEKSNTLAATQNELSTAANIQLSSLPRRFPKKPEFALFASMDPAKEVGGDFYDFFFIDNDHLALVAADVSGKGAPAALFMMRSKTIIKSLASSGMSPAKVLSEANSAIMESNDEDMFVTVWLGILEISTGILSYADAAHEKPLVQRNGEWELLSKPYTGFALGTIDSDEIEEMPPENQYVDVQIKLSPGDVIMEYTDGVTEATNAKNQLFGEGRLLEAVRSATSDEPKELLPFIRSRIDEFVGEAPQFDDLTMIGLRYNGPKQ